MARARTRFALALAVVVAFVVPGAMAKDDTHDRDATANLVAAIFLKVCFGPKVNAGEGAKALEALGATPLPPGRLPSTRHFILDSGTSLGPATISLDGTYCIASISAREVDLPTLVRGFDTLFTSAGAQRRESARDMGVEQDDLLASWQLRTDGADHPILVRMSVSRSTLDDGTPLVSFARLVTPDRPVMPPPAEPQAVDAPPADPTPAP